MAAQRIALLCLAALGSTSALRKIFEKAASKPLKVIVMAGQSNMEGFGTIEKPQRPQGTLRQLVNEGKFRETTDGRGGWKKIQDVTVWTTNQNNKTGALTVGYGNSPFAFGIELGFGIELYNKYREKMLIIKANWGGQSLGADFRPPSAIRKRGNPQGTRLVRTPSGDNAGVRYRDILDTVRRVTKNIASIVPNYDSRNGYEISAFLWHQGWNDAVNFDYGLDDPKNHAKEYEQNLADLIVDMRKDLQKEFRVVNDLPFILGSAGFAGSPNNHKNQGKFGDFVEKGLRMIWTAYDRAGRSSKLGRVRMTDSVPFARTESQSPGSQGYHWWENAETYYRLGQAMGKDTIRLIGGGSGPSPTPRPTPPSSDRRRRSRRRSSGGGFNGCVAKCKQRGHCCSDPGSSMNQLMSCSQACLIRDRGVDRNTCRRQFTASRSCSRRVNGITLDLCGDCRGAPTGCTFGVPNTTACLDGCSF